MEMEKKKIIQFKNIVKDFDGQIVLKGIDLDIYENEFVTLLGPSGCGKTTLLRILGGFIEPTEGHVIFDGQDILKLPPHKRELNTVFQKYALFPHMNVYDNIAFAQKVIEKPNRSIRKRVPQVLAQVGLSEKYKSFPKELSGGEQQRVALARALVNGPNILLADEPTGNLDPKNSWEIMKLLEEVNKRGTTVVVVTHNREIVDAMQKRVITMNKGVIVSDEEKGGHYYADKYVSL